MPEESLRSEAQEIAYVANRNAGPVDEVGKPSMSRPHESPKNTSDDQNANGVTRPHMRIECVVLSKKGDRESDDEAPMDDPDQRIPNVYLAPMSAAHSILLISKHSWVRV
jgi:hypothetical protein